MATPPTHIREQLTWQGTSLGLSPDCSLRSGTTLYSSEPLEPSIGAGPAPALRRESLESTNGQTRWGECPPPEPKVFLLRSMTQLPWGAPLPAALGLKTGLIFTCKALRL